MTNRPFARDPAVPAFSWSRVIRRIAPALVPLLLVCAGCGSSATLQFRCDSPINGGLLLTVDVVRASEEQAKQIQLLGEKWFYDPMRDSMRERITTVTFPTQDSSGRCTREVTISPQKKDRYLVVVADYKFQSPDQSRQTVLLPRGEWKGNTVRIAVHDREISVETR